MGAPEGRGYLDVAHNLWVCTNSPFLVLNFLFEVTCRAPFR